MPICETPRDDFAIARRSMKHRDQQHKADSPQPQENNEEQKENEESYEYKRIEDYEERL